jgi:superfamily II DNA/RNA helicase
MMTTFNELGVPARLVSTLARRGITEPFPIQEASIPDVLAGRDVLGKAPTGSGKTLAFGLPVLARVERAHPTKPRALILAPTRELAEQIAKDLIPLAKEVGRWVLAVYGGVGYDFQRRQIRRGVDVLVATPGRLIDLIEEGTVTLKKVDIVVVDEADRMADMGFMPQVKRLLDQTSEERQTILFSATLDGDVASLTQAYQNAPVTHEVASDEDDTLASHYFWKIHHQDRIDTTARIVGSLASAIVFTRTRHGADRVAKQLGHRGVDARAIHGGRSQSQRTSALQAFGSGRVGVLVATDVAARGIHVDGVAGVVHFDLPDDPKDYLHRSGRTARAGAEGVVVSLVPGDQVRAAAAIQRAVGLSAGFHDPELDWLTGSTGGRIGDRPTEPAGPERSNPSRNGRGGRSRRRNRGGGRPAFNR